MEGGSAMKPYSITLVLTLALLASAWALDKTSSPDRQNLNPLATVKSSDVRFFIERPLFALTRRPVEIDEEPQSEVEKSTDSSPQFVLLGVTSGPEGSVARISTADGTATRSLRRGESVDGWELRSIDPSSVTLTQDDRTIGLTIFRGNAETDDDENVEGRSSGLVFEAENADE